MKITTLIRAACTAGLAIGLAASASAAGISYTTNSPLTKFVGGGLTLNSTGGQAATLTFTPNGSSNSGVPSNIDLGDFLLSCPTCTTSQTTVFGAFTFNLVVVDTTDTSSGIFVGTSSGGTVSSDSSTINITFSPSSIGPGTANAATGDFGNTVFTVSSLIGIVAPNSGSPLGDTTVEGHVDSNNAPEPASFVLFGCALAGLGVARRKLASR